MIAWDMNRAEVDEQGRIRRIPNLLASDGRYDVVIHYGETWCDMVERLDAEHRFDAWMARLEGEIGIGPSA
jgi:hypothetical protein